MPTNYEVGRRFEYRVRDRLYKDGAVYVIRAAQSKGAVDLCAFWPKDMLANPYFCQCKTGSARMSSEDKARLVDLATQTGCVPILAEPGPKGRGVKFTILT